MNMVRSSALRTGRL